jgi:hypothetical protein
MLSNETLRAWQERRDEWRKGQEFGEWQERRRRRDEVRPAMRACLDRFVAGESDLDKLRESHNVEAYGNWGCFDLRGSAMFLNLLCKYVLDTDSLTQALRRSLPVPASRAQARAQSRDVVGFLEKSIDNGDVRRADVHPNRAIPFLSSWW